MYAHNYRLSSLKWIADSGEHTGGTQKTENILEKKKLKTL